jgi:UDP-N-acetylglucosamine--N-acetylmuramyl-(pentapeptide) pyrophosphoryl-undecaprenol N-acetylglucosamine transferase
MSAAARSLIVLAAGGTGGHMFPAEALAAELLGRDFDLALVTDRRGGGFRGALAAVQTHRIRAGGIAGKNFAARLKSAPDLAIGTLQARRLLKALTPGAVVGFGGYASVPTMLAAGFAGFKTAIHEQNAILGRANRLLASRVQRIATSFEHSQGVSAAVGSKLVHTGMPVRPTIAAARERPYPTLAGDGPVCLLVLGGSQGARVLSEIVPAAVARLGEGLRRRLHIAQQCRSEDLTGARAAYDALGIAVELATFFDDVPDRLAAAHLLIARAGASTVAELTAVGRPAILVPYPFAIDDHQTANAHAIDEAGAGWLMPQPAFTPEALAARLESLLAVPAILEKAAACARAAGRPDAAQRLADMVSALVSSNGDHQAGKVAA